MSQDEQYPKSTRKARTQVLHQHWLPGRGAEKSHIPALKDRKIKILHCQGNYNEIYFVFMKTWNAVAGKGGLQAHD